MSKQYGDWPRPLRIDSDVDDDQDGAIDLLTEKAFHLAVDAPQRDDGSVSGTTWSTDLWDAFYAGRAFLADTAGPLSPGDLTVLRDHRDDALLAWERVLAANVLHHLNAVLAEMEAMGTDDYAFEEHAEHWSAMKGYAFAFQFNRLSSLNDAQFIQLHAHLGQRPVLETAGATAVEDYRQELLAARAILQSALALDTADVEAW
jgi:hypothetical protein